MSGTIIAIGNVIGGAGGGGTATPPAPGLAPLSFRVNPNVVAGGSPAGTYALGLYPGGSYNFEVNWGDGTTNIITSPTDPNATHTYSGSVTNRLIVVTPLAAGGIDHWYFGNRNFGDGFKVNRVTGFGDAIFYANEDIFYGCSSLVIGTFSIPTFGNRVIIDSFFYNNRNMGNRDFSGWGSFTGVATSFNETEFTGGLNPSPFSTNFNANVNFTFAPTSLSKAFLGSTVFNKDLSNWDVSGVTDFKDSFSYAYAFNKPLNWTFSNNVADNIEMSDMFKNAVSFNQDISSWDTSRVVKMDSMFLFTQPSGLTIGPMVFNQDINSWDTSKVTDASGMFFNSVAFNKSLTNWFNTGSLTGNGIINMFDGATAFNGDVSGWDTSNCTNISGVFKDAVNFNKSISSWNTGNSIAFVSTFENAAAYDEDLSALDVSSAQFLVSTFKNATSFNKTLEAWDVSACTNMSSMFQGATSFNSDLEGWGVKTSNVTSFELMFNGADAFNKNIGSWVISSLTTASNMFASGSSFSDLNYGKLLQGWGKQITEGTVLSNVTLSVPGARYNSSSVAGEMRSALINTKSWTILDGGPLPIAPIAPFSFSVDTTNTEAGSSASNQYRLPLLSTATYDLYVNWGDNTYDFITSSGQAAATHTYSTSGQYTVTILSGTTPATFIDDISWVSQDGTTLTTANDRLKLLNITGFRDVRFDLGTPIFQGCSNMNFGTLIPPSFSNKVITPSFFSGCDSFTGNINSWGTLSGDATSFLEGATGANPDVNFISEFSDLTRAFKNAPVFNKTIRNWNVSGVTSLEQAFEGATTFNQDINVWVTTSLTNLSSTFNGATAFNQSLSSWDITNVTTAANMLTGSGISAANWDALLIGWAAQGTGAGSLQTGVQLSSINQFHGTVDTNANAAFDKLVAAPYNWTIIDLSSPVAGLDFTINTNNTEVGSSNSDQYRLPLMSTGTYSFNVNWGDGNSDTITTWNQTETTHTYASSGTYSVSMSGTIDHISWVSQDGTSKINDNDKNKVLNISDWGNATVYLNEPVFDGCSNLDITTTSAPSFGSKVLIDGAFRLCSDLSGDLSNWGTVASPITGSGIELYSQVQFSNANFNFVFQPTGICNRSFQSTYIYNNPLNNWDMSGVTDINRMFFLATAFNQDISSWDVSSVTNMRSLFENAAAFNQPIGPWTTTSLTDLEATFDSATVFNQDLSNWNTSSVTTMEATFLDAAAFDQRLSSWDISSLTTAANMLTGSAISSENWDRLLIGWAAQAPNVQTGVQLSNINQLHGSFDSAAIAAFNTLTGTYSWTIVDLGAAVVGNLLLDTSYGSGAEAAYSVRKLRTAYTGAAMQVQRTVGSFPTQEIGFDVNGNLDTATLLAYASGNEVGVSIWYDQSTNGNNATQISVGLRPIVVDSSGALVDENGKVALNFNSDTFDTNYSPQLGTASTADFYTASVASQSVASYGHTYRATGGGIIYGRFRNDQTTEIFVRDSNNQTASATGTAIPLNTQTLQGGLLNNGSVSNYINGSIDGTGSRTYTGSLNLTANIFIGSSNGGEPLFGNIQEFIFYASDKSSFRASIEENVGDYYTQNQAPYLLDTYTGAAAAYSLRLLDSTYTGFAIKVQDNVGGATQDIGFNVFGELDTVSLLQYAGSNDVFVETWYDQGGSGNNATQPSSGARPQIVTSGAVVVDTNGKPTVHFLANTKMETALSINSNPMSGFVAAFYGGSGSTSRHTFIGVGSTSVDDSYERYSLESWSNGGHKFWSGTGSAYQLNEIAYSGVMPPTILTGIYNSTGSNLFANGTASASNPVNTYTTGGTGVLLLSHRNDASTAKMSEAIIYTSDQSDYRTGIETNINTFYDIYTPTPDPLLLNLYPGSAAAYSLRKLNANYTGSAILVQDTVGGATKAIGFDANGDLDTAELLAYAGSNDVLVATWFDQSGSGNNAEQISSTLRPQIVSSGAVIVDANGKPAVEFDGSNDLLQNSSLGTNQVSEVSIYAVFHKISGGGNIVGWIGSNSGANTIRYTTSPAGYRFGWSSSSVGTDTGAQLLFTGQQDGANGIMNIDGTSQGTFTVATNRYWDNIMYIGNAPLGLGTPQMKMSEFVMYWSVNSASEISGIETNIGGYYDIVLPGLLDENPGAAAAYSLRRLSSTYTGSAVRVQRADNVGGTTDIGFDGYGNLDTAALTTAAAGNSMVVVTWFDQSGNSNDATQPSSLLRPKIYDGTTGVVTENGKPSVEFDGGDTLSHSSDIALAACSIFTTLTAVAAIRVWYGETDQNYLATFSGSVTSAASGSQRNAADTPSGQTLYNYTRNGSVGGTWYKNSLALTTTGPQTNQTLTLNSIGGFSSYKHVGPIQEIILYNSDQSDNRPSIEDNVGDYYGIEIAGLLDQYSGAAAAYSLRKLSNSYTGFAIKVQDNVGGATQDIGFNADGELDTVALLAYAGSNDVFVETWYDQSGSGNNATQPSSGLRPQIVTSGAVVVDTNGNPAMDFTGTQELKSASITAIAQPSTAISVVDTTGRTAQAGYFYSLGLTAWATIQDNSGSMRMYAGSAFVSGTSGTNTQRLDFSLFDGANSEIWFNGSSILTGNPGTNGISGIRIGGLNGPNFKGYFSEFIVYPSDQNAANNRAGIEANINFFYDIY